MTAFEIVRAVLLAANIYTLLYLFFATISFTALAFRTKAWDIGGFVWFMIVLFSVLTSASVVMWT